MIKFESTNSQRDKVVAEGYEAAIFNLSKLTGMLEIIEKHGALYLTTESTLNLIKRMIEQELRACKKYIENHNEHE